MREITSEQNGKEEGGNPNRILGLSFNGPLSKSTDKMQALCSGNCMEGTKLNDLTHPSRVLKAMDFRTLLCVLASPALPAAT